MSVFPARMITKLFLGSKIPIQLLIYRQKSTDVLVDKVW